MAASRPAGTKKRRLTLADAAGALLPVLWAVALKFDAATQPRGANQYARTWQTAFLLYLTWRCGWEVCLPVIVIMETARCYVLQLPVDTLITTWLVQGGIIWWVNYLRERYHDAQQRALRDGLTGLPNRRALDEFLDAELARSRRFHRPLAVAILDCDGFKLLNDQAGHAKGDAALQQIGNLLRRELRSYDGVFRMGGDEFAIVLPETDQPGAEHVCERLRTAFAHEVERTFPGLTASLGVAVFMAAPDSVAECLARADETMYQAKRTGRGETRFAVFGPLSVVSHEHEW